MSQSISINQKMRDEIAHKLTVQATSTAATKFLAEFKRQNDAFWVRHQEHINKLTGLTKKKQRELIQAGVMRAETTVFPEIPVFDEALDRRRWTYPFFDLLADGDARVLSDLELYTSGSGPISTTRFSNRKIAFVFRAESTVVQVDKMSLLEAGVHADGLLTLAKSASQILKSARNFRAEAMKVLSSCRTSRQLEDIWPEAAKLIPKRQTATASIVPKDAIDRVRAQLENGIPAEA